MNRAGSCWKGFLPELFDNLLGFAYNGRQLIFDDLFTITYVLILYRLMFSEKHHFIINEKKKWKEGS